jgi:hypothetical protein
MKLDPDYNEYDYMLNLNGAGLRYWQFLVSADAARDALHMEHMI